MSTRRGGLSGSMLDRLTAFYRENPGILEALADVVDDTLDSFLDHLAAAESSVLRRGGGLLLEGLRPEAAGGGDAGTESGVLRLLEELVGAPPHVCPGFRVVARHGGWLEFERSYQRSAVLIWDRSQATSASADLDRHLNALPVLVSLQAVAAQRFVSGRHPLVGERIQGSVFWESRPNGAQEAELLEERK